jgi:hypothetical protein
MTAGTIDRLHAVTANPGAVTYIPNKLDASALVGVLQRLGLTIPTSVSAAASRGEPLSASRHRFGIKEVDAALSMSNVTVGDRFRLKTAMGRNGILERKEHGMIFKTKDNRDAAPAAPSTAAIDGRDRLRHFAPNSSTPTTQSPNSRRGSTG